MFVGHTAVALAAKRRAPEISLGALLAAAITLDLLWPFFLLIGVEQVAIPDGATGFGRLSFTWYPWSHSLAMALVWAVMAMLIALIARASWRTALLIGALVVSHWVLDWVTHVPDLPLWPGDSPMLGLGLWSSTLWTFVIEGALFATGIWLYLGGTRARDRIGSMGFWSFIAVSALLWATTPFSAPPPSPMALGWFALFGGWVLVGWAWWADRHRVVIGG